VERVDVGRAAGADELQATRSAGGSSTVGISTVGWSSMLRGGAGWALRSRRDTNGTTAPSAISTAPETAMPIAADSGAIITSTNATPGHHRRARIGPGTDHSRFSGAIRVSYPVRTSAMRPPPLPLTG